MHEAIERRRLMITFCVPFYPWYRQYDRSRELLEVMIPAMNRCARRSELALSIADGGVRDVWGEDRNHDARAYEASIRAVWQGPLIYNLTENGITPMGFLEKGQPREGRVWIGRLVEESVMQADSEFVFINNIDIEIPVGFVDRYEEFVGPGRAWFPRCYHIHRLAPPDWTGGGYRPATGLVGIMKRDYVEIGGTDYMNYIKNRHDTDLYKRCLEKYECTHANLPGLLHRDHPGSCESMSEFNARGWSLS
jgi:hypothetical protein